MKFKIGDKVKLKNSNSFVDIGVVTEIDVDGRIWLRWNDGFHSRCWIFKDEVELLEEPEPTFKINPGKVVKVKKMVEVEVDETEEETYTITLGAKAAHELRTILGHMQGLSQLEKETKEFFEYLSDNDRDSQHYKTFLNSGTPAINLNLAK